MINVVFPPGWMSIHPLQPLGIATVAARLREAGLDARPVDLDIVVHEMNRNNPGNRLRVEKFTSPALFPRHLGENGNRGDFASEYRGDIERLMAQFDLGSSESVVFSIIGERQFVSAAIMAGILREKGIPTAAGGVFVHDHARWIAEQGIFDALFTGFDGVEMTRFCREAAGGDNRGNGTPIYSGEDPMDSLPKPFFSADLIPRYKRSLRTMYRTEGEYLVLQYQVDQGCNRHCSFCTRFQKKYRRKSPDKVASEIRELSIEHDTRLFGMITNAVNIDEKYSLQILREMASWDLGLEWYTYVYPDVKDPDLLKVMAGGGCRVARFGLECVTGKMLKVLNKHFTAEQAALSFQRAHREGLWVQASLIVGAPQETEEDIDAVCLFLKRYGEYIDSIRINPFFLQKGSAIATHPEEYGINIRSRAGSFVGFDEVNGPEWEEKVAHTLRSIDRIDEVRHNLGIGYSCLSTNLLLSALYENRTKEATRKWFAATHPYTFENVSSEAVRWRLYHAHEMELSPFRDDWSSIYGLTFEEGLH